MKKIIFVIYLCLITNASYAATEKVYLKCKKIVTQNKSTGNLADIFEVGNFGQIVLSEILISSKSSKITVYEPFPDFESYKDSFNKKIEGPAVTKQKAKIKDNSYSGADTFNQTSNGKKLQIINRYTFTIDNNNWSLKNRHLLLDEAQGININYIAEGKCVLVDKKYYKNFIKKGPSEADYNF